MGGRVVQRPVLVVEHERGNAEKTRQLTRSFESPFALARDRSPGAIELLRSEI